MTRGALAVVLSMVAATPAVADPPRWVGIWSAEPEWCANSGKIGSATPAPVELTASDFLGYENSCAITGREQIGNLAAWRFDLECQSERSFYDEQALAMMEGDDVLWWFYGSFEPVRFTRCP